MIVNRTTTRLPLTQTTTDGERGLTYSYGTSYDDFNRPQSRSEQNSYARFSQRLTYDAYGRPHTDKRTASLSGGASQEVEIKHGYAANGALIELKDTEPVEVSLWKLQEENARGQATQVLLGNGITKKRSYDALGYLESIKDGAALAVDYSYNKKQGVLNSRSRTGVEKESFKHDKRNRLTRVQKGLKVLEQSYDDYGRLADNPKRGEYHYNTPSRYAIDSITLNASGLKYYRAHPRQDVAYNLDRKAVSVHEHEFGWADFAYNAQMQRTHAWYGGEEENLNNRTYQKHYSSLFPAEITVEKGTSTGSAPKTTIVHYIGGDGYTAPVAKINDEVHYLHRNYLGSILAISDSGGNLIEERQFGAWGEIDYIKINGQDSDFSNSILPRGFTGHEHFSEIALIHMNGRMYDPQMRRFLSPDNNIPDPFDTRSFDRMAYVFHNPLAVIDTDGELPFLVIVAAIASAYVGGLKANNFNFNPLEWKYNFETFASIVIYAVVGGLSAGQALGVESLALSGAAAKALTVGQILTTSDLFYNLNQHLNSTPLDHMTTESRQNYLDGMSTTYVNPNAVPTSSSPMASNSDFGSLSEEIPYPFDPYNQESFLESSIPNLGNITIGGGGGIEIGPFTISPIGNGVDFNNSNEEDFRIFNELTGKVLCVYEKLEELSGGFRNAIKKFDGEFPVSHLKWTLNIPLNPQANASTSPPSDFLIEIKINPNKLDRPDLLIARTMVHELIHAEMWRKVLSILDNGGDLDGLTRQEWNQKLEEGDYPGIFDYYTRFGVNGFQHEQMAEYYRTFISNILKDFEPQLEDEIYEALAWAGLMGTGSINPITGLTSNPTEAWESLSQQERLNIINLLSNFNQNGEQNCN